MNLSEIAGAFATGDTSPVVEVDLSPFVGQATGTVVLSWREPSAAALYQIAADAREVKKRKPFWPDELCLDVATLGACHVAPTSNDLPPGLFYLARAADESDRGKKCWQYLILCLNEHFPHIKGVVFSDTDALKNWLCGSPISPADGSVEGTR